MTPAIPAHVLAAFGAIGTPQPLPGGFTDHAVRVGGVVLKRVTDVVVAAGLAQVLAAVQPQGARVARPVRARDGSWVVDGWSASQYLAGEWGLAGRERQAVAALDALHRALGDHVAHHPLWLATRTDAWAQADRIVWGEQPLPPQLQGTDVAALVTTTGPIDGLPEQIVNGDPNEQNLLFQAGQPPGFVDVAAYWRPADLGVAILLADAVAWQDSDTGVLDLCAERPAWWQLVRRGVAFRLVTTALRRGSDEAARRMARYRPVLEACQG